MPRVTVVLPSLRKFWLLRLLRWGLLAGALYDLGFALLMTLAPQIPQQWFHLPLPGEPFYLWLIAVLLAMLAGMYLLAAHDPRRYGGIVALAILGRGAGFLVLAAAAWGRPDLSGLWPLAGADLAFAAIHAVSYLPLRD